MSDTDFRAQTDGDLLAASPTTDLAEAEPLHAGAAESAAEPTPATEAARQAVKDGGGKLTQQATDKARMFADQGKARAGDALDQLSQLLTDAAATVDDKVGSQYGQYARTAAGQVATFSQSIRDKDVDELVDDVRTLVRKSPGIAIGAAATIGFVIARMVQAGIEAGAAVGTVPVAGTDRD